MSKRYCVRLVSYKGDPVNLLCWGDGAPWTGTYEEATVQRGEWRERNPGGEYVIEESTTPDKTAYQHLMDQSESG